MTTEPWVARLVDGPAADGVDRVFFVGPVWGEIVLAPVPPTHARGDHWVIVGGSGIPHDDDDVPWAGETRYALDSVVEALDLDDDMLRWVALYRVAT